jgi:epoxyqueuosine reductase
LNPELTNKVRNLCLEAGFYKVGFAGAEELSVEAEEFKRFLEEGRNADMHWLERNNDRRFNPVNIMPEALSVISLAYVYDTPYEHSDNPDIPKISRYAWGKRDYHKVIKKILKELCVKIESLEEGIKTRFYVDDGPIMEKAWAVRAGLGAYGKHTNVIIPEAGTFFFLSEVFINRELDYGEPLPDPCLTCRICMDACPTGAIYDEYKLNANLCISYQTIENRNEIPEYIDTYGWVFGCDICQDVCPYNNKKVFTKDENFLPRLDIISKTYDEHLMMTEDEFDNTFNSTPIKRTKYKNFIRNLTKGRVI